MRLAIVLVLLQILQSEEFKLYHKRRHRDVTYPYFLPQIQQPFVPFPETLPFLPLIPGFPGIIPGYMSHHIPHPLDNNPFHPYPFEQHPFDPFPLGHHPLEHYPLRHYPFEDYPLFGYHPFEHFPLGHHPLEHYLPGQDHPFEQDPFGHYPGHYPFRLYPFEHYPFGYHPFEGFAFGHTHEYYPFVKHYQHWQGYYHGYEGYGCYHSFFGSLNYGEVKVIPGYPYAAMCKYDGSVAYTYCCLERAAYCCPYGPAYFNNIEPYDPYHYHDVFYDYMRYHWLVHRHRHHHHHHHRHHYRPFIPPPDGKHAIFYASSPVTPSMFNIQMATPNGGKNDHKPKPL